MGVIIWSFLLRNLRSLEVAPCPIMSACYSWDGANLLIGTASGELYRGVPGKEIEDKPPVQGHSMGAINAISVSNPRGEFCTVGD